MNHQFKYFCGVKPNKNVSRTVYLTPKSSLIFAFKSSPLKSIPTTFLLDATGKVVAIDLRGDDLKVKIKELLGVK